MPVLDLDLRFSSYGSNGASVTRNCCTQRTKYKMLATKSGGLGKFSRTPNTQLLELRLLRRAKPNLSKDRVNYSTAPKAQLQELRFWGCVRPCPSLGLGSENLT